MVLVYYGGEDLVTKTITKKLIKYVAQLNGYRDLELDDANPRDRETKALEKLDLIIRLSAASPVVCVFDSDSQCVVELLKKYAKCGWKKEGLAINIAIDEGETWLMADRKGFSQYFGVKSSLLPIKQDDSQELADAIPYKTSLYFLNEIAPHTNKKKVRETFTCMRQGRKPPTYNNLWPDFIENYWNIDGAVKNSHSLQRAVQRVQTALQRA